MSIRARAGSRALDSVRRILIDRSFSDTQIEKIVPRLHEEHIKNPAILGEIVDCWNNLMIKALVPEEMPAGDHESFNIPPTASPPKISPVGRKKLDMTYILADIEPDLLLFSPEKLVQRHRNLQGLGFLHNVAQHWTILFNAPRGYYLQDWTELTKKIMYVDQKVVDLLYDKREQRVMKVHPLVSTAAVTETSFDHIRTRYLFAQRTGYNNLSHMRTVQTALTRPTLKELILNDDASYLSTFAPFCSLEEFSCFSDLIKNHDLDEEDAELYEQMAELESLRHPSTYLSPKAHTRKSADNHEEL